MVIVLILVSLNIWGGSLSALGELNEMPGAAPGRMTIPSYTALHEAEEVYAAKVIDEATVTELTEVSFYGSNTLGGIRREDNDSITTIDLSTTRELIIVDKKFISQRHKDGEKGKEFGLARKIASDGSITEGLLIPLRVVLCGVEKGTLDKKAWFLNMINSVVIHHNQQNTPLPVTHQQSLAVTPEQTASQNGLVTPVVFAVENKPSALPEPKPVVQAAKDVWHSILELIKSAARWFRRMW